MLPSIEIAVNVHDKHNYSCSFIHSTMQTSPRNEGLIFPVLAAALLSWSLISLVDLIVFLLIQFTRPKTGKLLCANLYLLISSVCYQCFLMLGAAL